MNKKTKILLLGPLPPPYHGVSVFTELLSESKELKKHLNLFTFNTTSKQNLEEVGRFSLKKIFQNIKIIYNFKKIIKKINPDIVYLPISQSKSGFLRDGFFILLSNKNSKKIIHLHGGNFHNLYNNSNMLFKKFINTVLKRVNKAIVLGESLKPVFKKWFKDNEIFVLYNGIKIQDHNLKANRDKNKIIIGYLGNLYKEKGFTDILIVFNELSEKYNNIEFHFAGEWFQPDLQQEIMEFIILNDLKSKVRFHGFLTGRDKEEFLLNTDIFVFNSYLNEGQPLVLLEALAKGCAIVSTNVGAIRETIQDQTNGFLIKPKDRYDLKQKIEILIKDEKLRKTMGEKSIEIFKNKFTFEHVEKNIIKIFNKTLEKQ